jgi:hypothetical protein
MLLARNGHNVTRWTYNEIGPLLGEKDRLVCRLAERGGELGDALYSYRAKSVARAIGMSESAWSNAKAGHKREGRNDFVHAEQLRRLAQHYHLDAGHYFGPDAWLMFTPDVAVTQLEQRLHQVGYGGTSFLPRNGIRAVDALLEWFRTNHDMTYLGISVVEARDFDGLVAPNRAAGIVDEATEERERSTLSLRPRDRISVQLDAHDGWHAVLLQLVEAPIPPYFTLQCLAPSYRQPRTELKANVAWPSVPDARGRSGFAIGDDAGRIDLIAILTRRAPLVLPFAVPNLAHFHLVDPNIELPGIKSALAELSVGSRRVLHAPLRVK